MTTEMTSTVAQHLEYLGYAPTTPDQDGWVFAPHPNRYDILFRPFGYGVRLHCTLRVGRLSENRDAWLDFLNTANEHSALCRFSLAQNSSGEAMVQIRAVLPGSYDRRVFGELLDLWHGDFTLLRNAPEVEQSRDSESDASQVSAVH